MNSKKTKLLSGDLIGEDEEITLEQLCRACELSEQEIQWKRNGTAEYQRLAERSLATMQRVDPLSEVEANRPRYDGSNYTTLGKTKGR